MSSLELIGTYPCTIDSKGRLALPAKLKKQLPADSQDLLVANCGLDNCISLFTREEWRNETAKLKTLNLFEEDDRRFNMLFRRGTQELNVDGNDRILLPKNLLQHAEIHTDVVLFAHSNRIEIWSEKNYNEALNVPNAEVSKLGQKVLGKKSKSNAEE